MSFVRHADFSLEILIFRVCTSNVVRNDYFYCQNCNIINSRLITLHKCFSGLKWFIELMYVSLSLLSILYTQFHFFHIKVDNIFLYF